MTRVALKPQPVPTTWIVLAYAVLDSKADTTEKLSAANALARLVLETER